MQTVKVVNQEEDIIPVVDKLARCEAIETLDIELTITGWNIHVESELNAEQVLQLVRECGGLLHVN